MIENILKNLLHGQDLSAHDMTSLMQAIIEQQLTTVQMSAAITALKVKGETITEITASVKLLRELATPCAIQGPHVVDTVGTGGDGTNTFNISTASAIVAAAAGATVAKHGGRSVSSKSGSADVLEAAGVRLDLSSEQICACAKKTGLGFMYAPQHHPALKAVAAIRRELGVRTLFNLLGPLTNPAGAKRQLIGVYDKKWLLPIAHVLQQLGSEHAMVVHSADGLDEISLNAKTFVAELKDNKITEYTIQPEDFHLQRQSLDGLAVNSAEDSLAIIKQVLDNKPGAAFDIVLLNAGATLYVAGINNSIADGVDNARSAISRSQAKETLQQLIQFSKEQA